MSLMATSKTDADGHVEEVGSNSSLPKEMTIDQTAFNKAKQDALSQGSPPWQVIKDNVKTCVVIVAVQTNGIILGLEYVLLGALVGVQAFDRVMGSYNAADKRYEIAAWTLSLWAGLFGLMYVFMSKPSPPRLKFPDCHRF